MSCSALPPRSLPRRSSPGLLTGQPSLTRLAERFAENEVSAYAGRRLERVENRPGAIGSAWRLKHLANTGVLDICNVQVDGTGVNRAG